MKKVVYLTILMLTGLSLGYAIRYLAAPDVSRLGPRAMQVKIVELRDRAIQEAKLAGNYRCCIDPPCTMCYMEANQWNNYTAGTCACDDLIAAGKEPCPQCGRGLDDIHNENNTFCDINATVPTCTSQL
jgi:hypothetical protein